MYRVAVCDDDLMFLKVMEKNLSQYFLKYGFEAAIDCFNHGHSLIKSIEKQNAVYDIIFLDIDMPMADGFLVAEKLRALCGGSFLLLFVTNMENEARRGYIYQAFRFIAKSRLEEELEESVRSILRVKSNLLLGDQLIEFKYKYENYYDLINIKRKEIIFMESVQRRVSLKTIYGDYDLLVTPLAKYQKMLSGNDFVIVSRSHLVNLEHVKDIADGFARLTGGATVCIGYTKAARENFQKKFMLYKREVLGL